MKPLDQLLTAIARDHLGIDTLATRRSDDLDFHVVPVWGIRAALEAAHLGGAQSTRRRPRNYWRPSNTSGPRSSSANWTRPVTTRSRKPCPSAGRPWLKPNASCRLNPTTFSRLAWRDQTAPLPGHSAGPWAYEYNPYTVQRGDEPGVDLPAFEIFDAEGNKLFDTNEDMPSEVQEANARLASAAPELLAVLDRCAILLADYDEQDGEEGDAYRDAIAVITAATSGRREP